MSHYLTLLACLSAIPLMAEMIGNVEYQLPQVDHGWKIANELQGDNNIQSITRIYIPESSSLDNVEESFAAHINDLPSIAFDQASLYEALEPQFPDQKMQLQVLEADSKSVLFEWSAGDEKRVIHSLVRAFDTEQGSVLLMYQTEKASSLESNRPALIQALKDAKLK